MPRLIRSRYEPVEVIGRGGQGEILRAIDRQHDRQVALKVRKVGSPEERGALLSEAKILLSLRPHRGLPLVRDDFFVRDRYYLVMDWVEGENLQRVLELRGDPGLPVSAVLGYLEDAAGALDHLHAHHPPIVHGDVKPANLILTSEGRVMLVDFGISRHAGNGDKAVGTAGFTAPEVVAGTGHGPSVDVYGLGATTFALLTGAPPSGIQPAWEGLARASAAAAERGIRQALSSDPARRPSSATQLVERLRSWQDTALPTGIVTFLFTDIEGSTALWEREPEHMKEVLARHNEILTETVEHHSGRLIQDRGEGDSTFSVFERASDAVRCALDIQLRLAAETWSGNVAIRVRIGVHSGEAELHGGAYTGNATNLAARIRSLAKGGQSLLSQATAGLVRGSLLPDCTLVDLGEHRLKGLAQGEQVFELAPELAAESSALDTLPTPEEHEREVLRVPLPPVLIRGDRAAFVGRASELERLQRLWDRVRAGEREFVFLSGEPGIGKTRLAMELARSVHAEGATVLYGRSDEETLTAYQPFVEALRQYVSAVPAASLQDAIGSRGGDIARIVPELAERLPDLPEPIKGDPEGQRYRLFEGVAYLLRAAAGSSPLLLILDDLHWADKPSLMMLRQLLRTSRGARLLVLGTYRETDLSRTHPLSEMLADLRREQRFERVTMAGLDEVEVRSLILTWAGSDAPDVFIQAVHQETEGNPFFVEEVLRHLRETGVVPEAGGDWTQSVAVERMAIPEGIREVVGRRLSRLGEASNRVLSVGSAIGRSFGLDVVECVSELSTEQVLGGIEEAMAAGLVEEDPVATDRYSFSHALVREALYQELTTSRRLRLHRRIGDVMEELCSSNPESCLAELAYHFVEAGSLGGSEKAIDYAERAGRREMALFAHEEAANHFERALQALSLVERPDEEHKARLLLALGEAQSRAGDARGKGTLIAAVDCARPVGESDVIACAALLYAGATEWSTAIAHGLDDPQIALLEEAYSALPRDDTPLRARVAARLAVALYWSDARERAAPLSLEAIQIAHRVGEPAALMAALEARRYALYRPENTDERIADANEALQLARESGDRDAETKPHRWLIAEHLELGDVATVDQEIEEHARLAADLRQPLYDCYTRMFSATRAIMSGRFREGEEHAKAAQAIGQQERPLDADHMFAAQMTPMWRVQGTLAEMADSLAQIVEEIPIPAARSALLMYMCDLGRVEETRGSFDQLAVGGFLDLPRDPTWLQSLGFLAEVCTALADAPRAEQLYKLILPYEGRAVTSGHSLAVYGTASHWLGMLAATMGRMEEAVRHFEAALQMTKAMDARPLTAVTQCEYASALLGAGQRDRARPHLDEALATAEELEMKATVERLQSLRSRGLNE